MQWGWGSLKLIHIRYCTNERENEGPGGVSLETVAPALRHTGRGRWTWARPPADRGQTSANAHIQKTRRTRGGQPLGPRNGHHDCGPLHHFKCTAHCSCSSLASLVRARCPPCLPHCAHRLRAPRLSPSRPSLARNSVGFCWFRCSCVHPALS